MDDLVDKDFSWNPLLEKVPMYGFGFRLAKCLAYTEMDQVELASRIGIHRSRIGQLIAMQEGPSACKTIVDIAKVFNVSLDWLLLGKESDPADDMARMIRKLPEDQQRLLKSQVEGWLAMARQDTRESSG